MARPLAVDAAVVLLLGEEPGVGGLEVRGKGAVVLFFEAGVSEGGGEGEGGEGGDLGVVPEAFLVLLGGEEGVAFLDGAGDLELEGEVGGGLFLLGGQEEGGGEEEEGNG